MTISPGQAAAALQDIAETEHRTRVSGGYAVASPHLILWGIVWALGYGGCALVPMQKWGLVWLPLVLAGALVSAWLGSRARRVAMTRTGAQSLIMTLVIAIFMGATYALFRPQQPLPYLVFPVLTMGLVYSLAGTIARLPRFAWIGCLIVVLTMAGYLLYPAATALWAAIAGGGGLVLGGLWLRKV